MPEFVFDPMPKWEIFCRVVDNYGDVGLCWRLARALAGQGIDTRLWVDDWKALGKLCPQAVCDGVRVSGVELRRWTSSFLAVEAADVVIEAFACELPPIHVQAMAAMRKPPIWINLEYLSAEDWVQGCHGLASPQANVPLKKFFFFPGFTEGTGGLIREEGLFARREAFLGTQTRADWLRSRGVKPPEGNALLVSLFSYEQAGLPDLLRCWQADARPVLLLVPEGRALKSVEMALGTSLLPGREVERDALRVAALPFSDQDGYDELLWQCDLNLVRGEDSFVRAQWAARPFVWQIYPQEENAHFVKLDAFLDRYRAGLGEEEASALTAFWLAWNGRGNPAAAWPALARVLPGLTRHARDWCIALGARPCLVAALRQFCRHIIEETG